jgi:hypothetical protein
MIEVQPRIPVSTTFAALQSATASAIAGVIIARLRAPAANQVLKRFLLVVTVAIPYSLATLRTRNFIEGPSERRSNEGAYSVNFLIRQPPLLSASFFDRVAVGGRLVVPEECEPACHTKGPKPERGRQFHKAVRVDHYKLPVGPSSVVQVSIQNCRSGLAGDRAPIYLEFPGRDDGSTKTFDAFFCRWMLLSSRAQRDKCDRYSQKNCNRAPRAPGFHVHSTFTAGSHHYAVRDLMSNMRFQRGKQPQR